MAEAIVAYNKAVTIKPDYAEAFYKMGNALKHVRFQNPNTHLHKMITSILDNKTYVRPSDIAPTIIDMLGCVPRIKSLLKLILKAT